MPNKNYSIQCLRALAVLLVVHAHAIDACLFYKYKSGQVSFYALQNWGAIGLDLFFIISGFIMSLVAPSYVRTGGWSSFVSKRFVRIFPLYVLLSALAIIVSFRMPNEGYSSTVLLKTIFLLPLFDSKSFSMPVIDVGWSLAFEIYFYSLITLFIFLKLKNYSHLVLFLFGISFVGWLLNPMTALPRFIVSPLMAEFGLGLIAGFIYQRVVAKDSDSHRRTLRPISLALTLIGIVAMGFSIFVEFKNIDDAQKIVDDNVLTLVRVAVWGISCFIFLLGFVLLEYAYKLKFPRLIIMLGDASYSCYLTHRLIVFPLVSSIWSNTVGSYGDLYIFTMVLSALMFSLLFYKCCELPLISLVNKRIQSPKTVPSNL